MDVGTSNNAVVVPDLLKVMEAAAVLRVGRTSAYEMAREYLATNGASGMPTVRIRGQLRIPRVPFEEWIGAPITVWPPLELPTDEDPAADQPVAVAASARGRRRSKSSSESPRLFSV